MKTGRETVVLRAAYWHDILPDLLGREGSESPWWLPLADLVWACLEQLIRTPSLTHVFRLLQSFSGRASTSVSLVFSLCPAPVGRWGWWSRILELYMDRAPDTAQAPVKHIALVWKPARCCWLRLFTSLICVLESMRAIYFLLPIHIGQCTYFFFLKRFTHWKTLLDLEVICTILKKFE